MGGVPPLRPPGINCGKEKVVRGKKGEEGAGARRDSLALRCPVITAQPDDPGSGAKNLNAETQRRGEETIAQRSLCGPGRARRLYLNIFGAARSFATSDSGALGLGWGGVVMR